MPPATSRPTWGWIPQARRFLALLAMFGAVGLLAISPRSTPATAVVPRLVVDLNQAPPAVLGALPKLGPALVGRIVAAREEAPFESFEDLDSRVRGIGPATIEALRPHLRIEMPEKAH